MIFNFNLAESGRPGQAIPQTFTVSPYPIEKEGPAETQADLYERLLPCRQLTGNCFEKTVLPRLLFFLHESKGEYRRFHPSRSEELMQHSEEIGNY